VNVGCDCVQVIGKCCFLKRPGCCSCGDVSSELDSCLENASAAEGVKDPRQSDKSKKRRHVRETPVSSVVFQFLRWSSTLPVNVRWNSCLDITHPRIHSPVCRNVSTLPGPSSRSFVDSAERSLSRRPLTTSICSTLSALSATEIILITLLHFCNSATTHKN